MTMEVPPEATYVLIAVITTVAIYYAVALARRLPLPPGPKSKLISGNAHQLPSNEPWKTFAEWSARFDSPIITYRLFTRRTIILNTWQAASDLLESRSKIYSDRPVQWMYHELVGRKFAVFNISSQHPRFPIYRRMLHSSLNPRIIQDYGPLLDKESRILLDNIASTPQKFIQHFRRNAGALILEVAYGWTVSGDDDYFVGLMEEIFKLGVEIFKPGRWLVDVFPILRFVPAWFPGAGFQRHAAAYRAEFTKLESIPHGWAKEQIESGNFLESFTSQHLRPEDGHVVDAEEEEIIKWCSAGLYAGGADTTVAALTSFVLLMALHPDVQQRAQAEIDAVLGQEVLPACEDEAKLPYVTAVIKEVLRYAPVVPLGLAHRVLVDDEYLGYRIPQGSTIYANIWAIGRDPQLYKDADSFNPSRFLGDSSELDPRKLVFGFGRRICPGMHFAEKSLFLNISRILASFTILRPLDDKGREVDIEASWVGVLTSHPKPFQCRIVPRSGAP